jgi:hypothetical protein
MGYSKGVNYKREGSELVTFGRKAGPPGEAAIVKQPGPNQRWSPIDNESEERIVQSPELQDPAHDTETSCCSQQPYSTTQGGGTFLEQ